MFPARRFSISLLLFISEYDFSHVDYFITTVYVVHWPLLLFTVQILGYLVDFAQTSHNILSITFNTLSPE